MRTQMNTTVDRALRLMKRIGKREFWLRMRLRRPGGSESPEYRAVLEETLRLRTQLPTPDVLEEAVRAWAREIVARQPSVRKAVNSDVRSYAGDFLRFYRAARAILPEAIEFVRTPEHRSIDAAYDRLRRPDRKRTYTPKRREAQRIRQARYRAKKRVLEAVR